MNLILELVFPNRCIVCEDIINFGINKCVCNNCKDLFELITGPRCNKCSRPIESGFICRDCANKKIYFEKNFSVFVYKDLIQDLIIRFKFRNHPAIGKGLAKIISENINQNWFLKKNIIIPVPIHKTRKRKRGFNQAEIIAKYLAKKFNLEIKSNGLKRIKNTKPQWMLDHDERENNLNNAFWADKNLIKNKNIILIDDIFTTGSTINKCAEVLKLSGASCVYSLTVAITSLITKGD